MCVWRARGKMSPLLVFIILTSTTYARKHGSYGRTTGHGAHSYPQSTGYSGYGSQTHSYPQYTNYGHGSQTHNTQSAAGSGGSHSYPSSTGLSGSGQQRQPTQHTQQSQGTHYSHTTKNEVHHHYHYSPPPHITYGSHTLPVYHGNPPVYVYEYRDSGSRFDTLLTGLALYNLGKMSASHHHHDYHDDYNYRSNPGEICKLGISKNNGDYEETRIDCQLMSSFIWEAQANPQPHDEVVKNTVTSNVVNVSTNNNGTVTSSVTVTNTTVVDAREVKGPSIEVKPGMKCFLMRISRDTSVIKKTVDCGVLQVYATSSIRRNSSTRVLPVQIFVLSSLLLCCLQILNQG